jgi:hypothetical protein
MPYLARRYGWDLEQRLWFAFLNGCSQHPPTTLLMFQMMPAVTGDLARFARWFESGEVYGRLGWDTDRRYVKAKLLACIESYRAALAGRTQAAFFAALDGGSEAATFRRVWDTVMADFAYFGRLATFSYLEYLRIMGLPLDCDSLFLDDRTGSKSHRNGLCKVLGRDDLDWHDTNLACVVPDGQYPPAVLRWLDEEAALLLAEAKARAAGQPWARDVSFFTLESTLCCYKSWHRPNRRYPNVYNDMLYARLRKTEAAWGPVCEDFWAARREALPAHLRLEDTPRDPGLCPLKQNHYRETGEVIMMDREWPAFRNEFNAWVARC